MAGGRWSSKIYGARKAQKWEAAAAELALYCSAARPVDDLNCRIVEPLKRFLQRGGERGGELLAGTTGAGSRPSPGSKKLGA